MGTWADLMGPNGMKAEYSTCSVTCLSSPPTYSARLFALPAAIDVAMLFGVVWLVAVFSPLTAVMSLECCTNVEVP